MGGTEIFQQVILQAKKHCLCKHPAARLQIAVNVLRPRRILLPVRELIAVGLENQIFRQKAARLGFEHEHASSHAGRVAGNG